MHDNIQDFFEDQMKKVDESGNAMWAEIVRTAALMIFLVMIACLLINFSDGFIGSVDLAQTNQDAGLMLSVIFLAVVFKQTSRKKSLAQIKRKAIEFIAVSLFFILAFYIKRIAG